LCINSDHFSETDSDPELSFAINEESTPVNQYIPGFDNQIVEYWRPDIPEQLIPSGLFALPPTRAFDQGIEIPAHLILLPGEHTGYTRRTLLWDKKLSRNPAPLPLQQSHFHSSTLVESLYRNPADRRKYYKVYIEHEYRFVTRDTSQIRFHLYRGR
jgi:hypothetical protein